MKATLKFDLSDPEDRMSHLRCVKSVNMAQVLFDVIYNFPKRIEYAKLKEDQTELDYFYEILHNALDEEGVNIDELIA